MMKCLLPLIWVLFSAILLTGQPSRADGCFIPPPAFEVPPPIPAQRAVIAWDGKIETLLVESSLDAKGQSFGWMIPLPNVPSVVEKGTPDIINTLDLCCRPRIIPATFDHWLSHSLLFFLIFTIVPMVLMVRIIRKNQGPTDRDLMTMMYWVLGVGLFAGMLLPALVTAGRNGILQPAIRLQTVVGNYEISVLECKKPEELEAWLSANGFAKLPSAGKPIVEDYIKRKWCFVASKLQMDGDGPRAPHPLHFKFPVNTPVYPMKLTALANSPVYLKLFVIAPQRAEIPGLRTDAVLPLDQILVHSDISILSEQLKPWLETKNRLVTAATAIIKPSAMQSDMNIDFSTDELYYRRIAYTRQAAWQEGAGNAGIVFFIGLLSILLGYPVYGPWLVERFSGARRLCLAAFALVAMVSALVIAGTYLYLPKVADARVVGRSFDDGKLIGEAFDELKKNLKGEVLAREVISQRYWEILRRLSSEQHHPLVNPYTGNPIKEEASPGNFTIETTPGNVVMRYYWLHPFGQCLICKVWPFYKESKK